MESLNSTITYNCTKCQDHCLYNEDSLCCDNCDEWTHFSCTKITKKHFKRLSSSNLSFYCQNCELLITCPSCSKYCQDGENSILCDCCNRWQHLKCTSLSYKEFKYLSSSNLHYYCDECFASFLPFYSLDTVEFGCLFDKNNSTNKAHSSITYNTDLLDNKSFISPSQFKNNFFNKHSISILNINIRSLNKNFDRLESLLDQLEFKPDIISVMKLG